MQVFKEGFWILLFLFAGEIISFFFSSVVTIPSSVIGMLLLFLSLHFKWLKQSQVRVVADWLSEHMTIMFIPLGVGLVTQFDQLGHGMWWKLLLVLVLSTAVIIAVVGLAVQFIMHQLHKVKERK